jgi:hypothetical protein
LSTDSTERLPWPAPRCQTGRELDRYCSDLADLIKRVPPDGISIKPDGADPIGSVA